MQRAHEHLWVAPQVAVEVDVQATMPGPVRCGAAEDHVIGIHASEPVRFSSRGGAVRSVTTRGEISVMPAGTYDEWIQDDPSETVLLHMSPKLFDVAAEELGLDAARAGLQAQCGLRDHQVEHIAWALLADYRAGLAAGRLYVESLGFALAVHLLTRYRAPSGPRGGLSSPQLTRVRDYVEAHLKGDVSLVRLARVAGVSASHFRVLFKRSTGVTVHEYVIRRRVERARTLLLARDVPLSQVALEAGFAHQSHMARWMRQVLGTTPAAIARARA